MKSPERLRVLLPLVVFTAALMLLSPFLLGGLTRTTKIEIGNESLAKQATAVASGLATELTRAAAAGIPLAGIPRMDEHFATLRAKYPSIRFLALVSADGKVLQFSGPEETSKSLLGRLARFAMGPKDMSGQKDRTRPIELRTGAVAVEKVKIATKAGDASLLYGLEPTVKPPAVTPEFTMLGSMVAVLFILGMPILYDMCRRFLFRPIRQLDFLFSEAAQGRFHTFPVREAHPELHGLLRLWNNEILSLQERRNQFEAFARDAIASADDDGVIREIEHLMQPGRWPARIGGNLGSVDDRFGAELRVPALLLAFLAGGTYGNWPDINNGLVAGLALMLGLACGWWFGGGRVALIRRLLFGSCLAMAAVMLASGLLPYLVPQSDIPASVWVIPNAALLGILLGAAVLRPTLAAPDYLGPVGVTTGSGSFRRHESPRLLLHVGAGLLAAVIWSTTGPSEEADTLEVWIAAVALPIIAARLRSRP